MSGLSPVRLAPFVVALLLAVLGAAVPAALLLLTGVGLVQLERLRPDRAGRVDRRVSVFAHYVAQAVGAVALTLCWALLVVPASALAAALRRDPWGRWRGWARRSSSAEATDAFGLEPRAEVAPSGLARVAGAVPLVVGWVAIVVVANYALGWLWDEAVGGHDRPAAVALAPTADPAELATRPALADAPWAEDHLRAYAALDYEYRSFLMEELVDGAYGGIVIEDRRRHTHTPAGLDETAPEVWLFGGSTVFGKAQRDEHTIASALARAVEEAGRPARVLNFGNPGYTSYQTWQLFERQLARRGSPAVAVFLEGTADVEVQAEAATPDPTHFNRRRVDLAVTGEDDVLELGELWARYQDDSLTGRLWDGLQGLVGFQPAAADDGAVVDHAADLGARARRLVEHLGERDGAPVLYVREPAPIGGPDRAEYVAVGERLPEPDLDLTDLLAGRRELYADWIHVNEAGARIVAEALLPEVLAHLE